MKYHTIQSPWDSIINNISTVTTENSKLKIYPNPTNDYSVIEASSNCPGNINIALYDLSGEKIQTIFDGKLIGQRKLICPTSQLSSGMYFVALQTDCETRTLKFLKF